MESVKNGLHSISKSVWLKSHERHWTTAAGIICAYGLLKEFRPSEPFLNEYLMAPDRNFSSQEISKEIFPVWTYSLLLVMIPVFLLTDVLLYKPMTVLQGIALVATYVIFVSGKSKAEAMLAQIGYALSYATEIAYYTYIYAAIHSDHYQKATSFVRAIPLLSRFLSASVGQLLISLKAASYYTLYCISLVAVVCGFLLSVFIPSIQRKPEYETASDDTRDTKGETFRSLNRPETTEFHHDGKPEATLASSSQAEDNPQHDANTAVGHPQDKLHPEHPAASSIPAPTTDAMNQNTLLNKTVRFEDSVHDHTNREENPQDTCPNQLKPSEYGSVNSGKPDKKTKQSKHNCCTQCCRNNFSPIWHDFKQCYTNTQILKWSLWCSLAVCTFFQVNSYTYRLLHEIAVKEVNGTHLEIPVYNGAMEATACLVGSVAVLLAMWMTLDMMKYGELLMGVASVIMAVVLLIMGSTQNVWVAFAVYVLFKSTYHLVITVAAFQIARQLTMENAKYAMVLGFNSFEGFLLQTIITLIVEVAINAPVGVQFLVSSVIMFLTGGGYLLAFILLQNKAKDTSGSDYRRF